MGAQRKSSEKTSPQSQVMHKKPTNWSTRLKIGVENTRRYKSRMEIFTAVMVSPYVIIAGIMNWDIGTVGSVASP